jgi:hypothetical protein
MNILTRAHCGRNEYFYQRSLWQGWISLPALTVAGMNIFTSAHSGRDEYFYQRSQWQGWIFLPPLTLAGMNIVTSAHCGRDGRQAGPEAVRPIYPHSQDDLRVLPGTEGACTLVEDFCFSEQSLS